MTVGFDSEFIYEMHFNSHAHVERDTEVLYLAAIADNFNSHAHVESDVV